MRGPQQASAAGAGRSSPLFSATRQFGARVCGLVLGFDQKRHLFPNSMFPKGNPMPDTVLCGRVTAAPYDEECY